MILKFFLNGILTIYIKKMFLFHNCWIFVRFLITVRQIMCTANSGGFEGVWLSVRPYTLELFYPTKLSHPLMSIRSTNSFNYTYLLLTPLYVTASDLSLTVNRIPSIFCRTFLVSYSFQLVRLKFSFGLNCRYTILVTCVLSASRKYLYK